MLKTSALVIIALFAASGVSAQTEADLKQYFEGRHVALKLDMPATKDGVNVYPDREQSINYSEYASRIKRHGTSIRCGESILVTKVKVKDKHIEFQLGGGGYGTVGDETDSSVYVQTASRSRREKHLEDELKRESDPQRRKRLKDELSDLRREREREDRINRELAADAQEAKRARIEQKALQGGSRFNVYFSAIPTPDTLMMALSKYVDFSEIAQPDAQEPGRQHVSYHYNRGSSPRHAVVRLGPATTYLKEGLTTQEVVRFMGQPARVSRHSEPGNVVVTYEFPRSEGRTLYAEFINDVLVRSRTDAPRHVAKADTRTAESGSWQ